MRVRWSKGSSKRRQYWSNVYRKLPWSRFDWLVFIQSLKIINFNPGHRSVIWCPWWCVPWLPEGVGFRVTVKRCCVWVGSVVPSYQRRSCWYQLRIIGSSCFIGSSVGTGRSILSNDSASIQLRLPVWGFKQAIFVMIRLLTLFGTNYHVYSTIVRWDF